MKASTLTVLIQIHSIMMLFTGPAWAEDAQTPVNLNDETVTEREKVLDQRQTKEANRFAAQQSKVINTVPGVDVSPEDLMEKPAKKGFSLNPIRWVFGPVIKLQEQTVRLQQQMMKLTGPIAALQPAMLNLQNRVDKMGGQLKHVQGDMQDVRSQMSAISDRLGETVTSMKGVETRISTVSDQMSGVQHSIKGTYAQLKDMRPDLRQVRSDIGRIRGPITRLQEPLISMVEPIHNLNKQVTGVYGEISDIRAPLVNIEKPITSLDKQLTGLSNDISELRKLLSLVLTSIFAAAAIVAIGTPVAAIFIWRTKNKILPAPKPDENSEDEIALAGAKKPVSSRR